MVPKEGAKMGKCQLLALKRAIALTQRRPDPQRTFWMHGRGDHKLLEKRLKLLLPQRQCLVVRYLSVKNSVAVSTAAFSGYYRFAPELVTDDDWKSCCLFEKQHCLELEPVSWGEHSLEHVPFPFALDFAHAVDADGEQQCSLVEIPVLPCRLT